MPKVTPEEIDAILPQTQCGLCGHGGCMPYAEALVYDNEEIHLCPPGGIPTMHKIGELLNKDPAPYEDIMRQSAKPKYLAVVREDECIGCTKCIQACPVDAIIGAAKEMHVVISDECTGCELCVPPCPVDCIDLVATESARLSLSDESSETQRNHYRERFLSREKRLKEERKAKNARKLERSLSDKKNYIQQAIERANAKKNASDQSGNLTVATTIRVK